MVVIALMRAGVVVEIEALLVSAVATAAGPEEAATVVTLCMFRSAESKVVQHWIHHYAEY